MNLQEHIKKVLREERDRSNLMVKLLNTTIIPQYETICKVEVTAPWNRKPSSGFYNVKVFFVSSSGKNPKDLVIGISIFPEKSFGVILPQ